MLSATASTPHHTIEIQPPIPQSPAVEGPSTLAIEMLPIGGTARQAERPLRTTAQAHRRAWGGYGPDWYDYLCEQCQQCLLGSVALAASATLITLASLGVSGKGPMYINRDCSLSDANESLLPPPAQISGLNTTAEGNSIASIKHCANSPGMIVAVALTLTGAAVLLLAGAVIICGSTDEFVTGLKQKASGQPFPDLPEPDDVRRWRETDTPWVTDEQYNGAISQNNGSV